MISVPIALHKLVEWLECDHDHGDVVEAVGARGCMQHLVDCEADDLVYCLRLISDVVVDYGPDAVVHLLGRQLVEDAVRARQHVVQLFAAVFLEVDFGLADYDIWVSSKLRLLCLKVSKGSTDGQSTWENSIWPYQWVVHCVLFHGRLVNSYLLQTRLPLSIDYGVRLVNVSSGRLNPPELRQLSRLVILAKIHGDSTVIFGANGSAITDIDDV